MPHRFTADSSEQQGIRDGSQRVTEAHSSRSSIRTRSRPSRLTAIPNDNAIPAITSSKHVDNLFPDFWRNLPVPNPFHPSSSPQHYSAYLDALRSYCEIVVSKPSAASMAAKPRARCSIVPHLITAISLGRIHLSDSQLSRVSARAVYFAARGGRVFEALEIIDALHMTLGIAQAQKGIRPGRFAYRNKYSHAFVEFNRQISPNLSYHRLVHFQIRGGHFRHAAQTVLTMMNRGIRPRNATLVAIVRANCLDQAQRGNHIFSKPPRTYFDFYRFAAQQSQFYGTESAYNVVASTRRYGYPNIKEMYIILINTCLFRGEGIIASVLYRSLLWNDRDLVHPDLRLLSTYADILRGYRIIDLRAPFGNLINWIMDGLKNNCSYPSDESRYQASLQTLINLVVAVNSCLLDRSLPTSWDVGLRPIFDALTLCPDSSYEVWVFYQGFYSVNFHRYTRSFVLRYINGLVKGEIKTDRETQRALLRYTLLRLNSPRLAAKMVRYMIFEHLAVKRLTRFGVRKFPLEKEDLHLLIHSGAHLRRGDYIAIMWERNLMWDIEQIHRGPAFVPYPWGRELDEHEEVSALDVCIAISQLTHALTTSGVSTAPNAQPGR